MPKKFPFYKQLDQMDCGPTCLRMIAKFYGLVISVDELRDRSFVAKDGVSFAGLAEAAESINFHTLALNIPFSSLKDEVPLPCIAYWRQRHFVVIYKILLIVSENIMITIFFDEQSRKNAIAVYFHCSHLVMVSFLLE
jgi:ABC-type bacteriocin/lantibiotic exporter with double-glycine peptidase domain